jgi:hypothetical protein
MPRHASYMPQPPQPPSHQVGLERADAEPLLQRLRRDVVLLHRPVPWAGGAPPRSHPHPQPLPAHAPGGGPLPHARRLGGEVPAVISFLAFCSPSRKGEFKNTTLRTWNTRGPQLAGRGARGDFFSCVLQPFSERGGVQKHHKTFFNSAVCFNNQKSGPKNVGFPSVLFYRVCLDALWQGEFKPKNSRQMFWGPGPWYFFGLRGTRYHQPTTSTRGAAKISRPTPPYIH